MRCFKCGSAGEYHDRKMLSAMAGDLSQQSLERAVSQDRPMCYSCARNSIEATIIREVHAADAEHRRWGKAKKQKAHSASR